MVRVSVTVLGTVTGDSTPSFFINVETNTQSKRFLFNCGEGTQRYCIESATKLVKFDSIFLTRLCWEYVGGLPGAILTVADAGVKNVHLSGPKNVAHFLESTRYFISRPSMNFLVTEFNGSDKEIKDSHGTFIPIVLQEDNQVTSTLNKSDDDYQPNSSVNINGNVFHVKLGVSSRKRKTSETDETISRSPSPRGNNTLPLRRQLCSTTPVDAVVCYAFHSPEIPGKFDAVKAKTLGVKPGPEFGKLSKGESVVTPLGTVHPSDVISPTQPGPVVMVVECQSQLHLKLLLQNEKFNPYLDQGIHAKNVRIVVHILCAGMISNETYKKWMSRFDATVEHTIISPDICPKPVIFNAWTINQIKLNSVESFIFPIPYSDYNISSIPNGCPKKTKAAENLLSYELTPKPGWDNKAVPKPLDRDTILKELNPEIQSCINNVKETVNSIGVNRNSKEPMVVFLGTVAAVPSKHRNVSANLVHIPDYGNILMDAGEGTLGQMFRRFGTDLEAQLLNVKIIFLSHIHADHHLGTLRILLKRQSIANDGSYPVVVGPVYLDNWLKEYSEYEPLKYKFIDISKVQKPDHEYSNKFLELIGLTQFQSVPVIHCPEAYGLVISHKNNWKIVYSGDTRPCATLVNAGEKADLVIHEATFEDELQQEALEKFHATTSEAIDSCRKMGAKFLMMNHFSSRYPKVPTFDEGSGEKTSVAFDLMSITFSDFQILPKLLPAMKAIFSEPENEENEVPNEPTEQQKKKEERNPKKARKNH